MIGTVVNTGGATLVGAIELVSPANKDRPESRRAFVAKTAWFYLLTRPSAARLRLSAQGMYAGLRGGDEHGGDRRPQARAPSRTVTRPP